MSNLNELVIIIIIAMIVGSPLWALYFFSRFMKGEEDKKEDKQVLKKGEVLELVFSSYYSWDVRITIKSNGLCSFGFYRQNLMKIITFLNAVKDCYIILGYDALSADIKITDMSTAICRLKEFTRDYNNHFPIGNVYSCVLFKHHDSIYEDEKDLPPKSMVKVLAGEYPDWL